MKFTIRRRDLSLNLKERIGEQYQEYCIRRHTRLVEKIRKLETWHKKFAWRPMRLDTDNDRMQWCWLETTYQKAHANLKSSGELIPWRRVKVISWDRHAEKDYFKNILKGDIQNNDGVSGETTQMDTSTA